MFWLGMSIGVTVGILLISIRKWILWKLYCAWDWFIDWYQRQGRVSDRNPSTTLPCDWCGKVLPTAETEVWCRADPKGYIVRLCEGCGAMCAG